MKVVSERNQRRLVERKKDKLQEIFFDFVNEYKESSEADCNVIYNEYLSKWKEVCKRHNSVRSNTYELNPSAFEIMCRNKGILKQKIGFWRGIADIFLILIGKK